MAKRIGFVEPGSIADQLGVRAGDVLYSINGENVFDFVDYEALSCAKNIDIDTSRGEYVFEKDEFEPLGIRLAECLTRVCLNKCAFCFVDQLPPHVRDTMRVKDDDWRLSLMMGNFVTLTNVFEGEIKRIIRRGASPLYISVHATDPDARRYLLGNPGAGDIMEKLRALAAGGIAFHTQAVLCPGINDGEILEKTMNDLYSLAPSAMSLALVPVGLTAFRDGLAPLAPFDRESAGRVLDAAERFSAQALKECGTRFVFPSDEFYLQAGREAPSDEEYEGYSQIDNGVGLLRLFRTEFEDAWRGMPKLKRKARKRLIIATGTSAAPFFRKLLDEYPVGNLEIEVRAVKNHFFGESVTVAGLLTGGDILRELAGAQADRVLITGTMLRDGAFLDDARLEDVEKQAGVKITPVGRRGDELLDELINISEEKDG